MPLVKATLEAELTILMNTLSQNTNAADSQDKFIKGLTTAIDNYIKTGLVTTPSPLGGTPLIGTIT